MLLIYLFTFWFLHLINKIRYCELAKLSQNSDIWKNIAVGNLNCWKSAAFLLFYRQMKNKTILIFAVSIIFLFILGCGITDSIKKSIGGEQTNANSTAPTKPTDENDKPENPEVTGTTPDEEKIGIPECDEVFEMLTEQMKPKEDETYITKATRQTILNSIRDSFKESIKNEKDKEKLTRNCKKYLEQLKKYKAEEDAKN